MRARGIAAVLLFVASAPAVAADGADLRAEFKAALDRVTAPGTSYSEALRGYLLYPYVEAARLRHALSRVPAHERAAMLEGRIRAFLKRHLDEPVARELMREWLGFLGERAAWAEFEAAAPAELADLPLRCYALQARLAQRKLEGVREAALELWLSQKDTPPACAPVFGWLDSPDRLSDAEIEARTRFAAVNRVPLPAARAVLLPSRRAVDDLWERLMREPERALKRFLDGETPPHLPVPPDADVAAALVEAFTRLARQDSRRATDLYDRLREHPALDEVWRRALSLAYALGLAYDHDPAALKVFEELPAESLDALGHEWRVRAALLHGEWKDAQKWIEAMPEPQRNELRWRYWRARALEHRWGHKDDARLLYEDIAGEREYYAFLAAGRLGRKPDLRPVALTDDGALQAELAALAPMRRARELLECQLTELAYAELRYALRGRSPAEKAQAVRMAAGWGWHLPAVMVLSELQLWDDLWLRFPLPYDAPVEAAAKETGVPADWLYAVLRTESLYDPRAVSRSGALGLLQLLLPTARQVARKASLAVPSRDDLFEPGVNIALGARYLRELHDRFGGRLPLTLAAYNAGPMRIPSWLPARKPVDADVWIENIPYNETRAYVQRGLSALVIVGWRRSGEPTPLMPLLSPVPTSAELGAKAS